MGEGTADSGGEHDKVFEEPKVVDEQANVSDEQANVSDEQANVSDEQATVSEQATASDEQATLSDEQVTVSDEQVKVSDELTPKVLEDGSHAMVVEDENSQQREQERADAPAAADIATVDDDDHIESSLLSELEAQNPERMGSPSQQDEVEEGVSHLFTEAMKLQLRAQILVLGDLLKGVTPNPEWLEDACLEPAIGNDFVLLDPVDGTLGAQNDDIPAETNTQRIASDFQDTQPLEDIPSTGDGMKDELRSSERSEPSSSGKDIDDSLTQAAEGQLVIAYDHTQIARSDSDAAEDSDRAAENRILESDKHLDLAQASAQDALTTATSALAQSHMVWARLHSQDHSEEGIARDARLASVAATVAAASSVAKAAVEAARAIAEVSMDAFIQASGYQIGDADARTPQTGSARTRPLQVDVWERTPYSNPRENATPSQQRADMLESVVQAAGKAAEAAAQAGEVLSKANPMVQTGGFSGFWPSRKADEAGVVNEKDEANDMGGACEVDGEDEVGADIVKELDEPSNEDAEENMVDLDATQPVSDGLEFVNQTVEAVVAAANGDEEAAAIENEVAVADGDEEVAADGVEEVAGDQAGVPGDEVAAVNEVTEQDKRFGPRARKFKRGRGRLWGNSTRAKRYKVSGAGPSPLPAQTPENAEPDESLKIVQDENKKGRRRGSKRTETTPGKDAPAATPDDAAHKVVEASEIQQTARDRALRAEKRNAMHTPATTPVHVPEDEIHKQDGVSTSRKNPRGRSKSATKQIENRLASTTGEGVTATEPAAQGPVDEQPKEDDVQKSGRKGGHRKKSGTKNVETTPVSTSVGDTPAAEPENELHKKDNLPAKRKNARAENARVRARNGKQAENATVSSPGKDTADPALRDPETDANTHEEAENAIREGSAVEVMIDEVGLRGGWFAGKVVRRITNEVFVELHDLLTDDGKANIREWFPLVEGFNSDHRRRHARPVHPFTIFNEAGSRKRRRVALGSQTWHVGDQVDAFFQDGWWEGIVAELNDLDPSKATVYFPEENDTQIVKTWDLRPSFQWKDEKWIPWKNLALVEDERAPKRHRGPNKDVSKEGGPEKVASTGEARAEGPGSKTQEVTKATPEPTGKEPIIESKTPAQRTHWKKSGGKKNGSTEQQKGGPSTSVAHETEDALAPGTSKQLDFAAEPPKTDEAAATQGKASEKKKKRRRRRYT